MFDSLQDFNVRIIVAGKSCEIVFSGNRLGTKLIYLPLKSLNSSVPF